MNKLHKTVPDFTFDDLLYDRQIQLFAVQIALGVFASIIMLGLEFGVIQKPEIADKDIPLYLGIYAILLMAALGKIFEIRGINEK